MYAVIETGGKQYRVEVGTELAVELLDAEPGDSITIERVLLVADGDEASIGRPLVGGASVSAEVLRRERADKVVSFKYRPKARRRVKKGHRQEQTILRVTDVVVDGRSAAQATRKAEADAKTERQRLEEAAARQAAEDAALAAKLAARSAPKARESADAKAGESADTKAGEGADAEAAAPKTRPSRAKAAPKAAGEPAAGTAAPKKTTRAKAAEDVPAVDADVAESAPTDADAAPAPKRSRTKKDE